METYISLLLILTSAWLIRRAILRNTRRIPYPPGPQPKPLIGNLLDFPLVAAHVEYAKWTKRYNSPILHLEALGSHLVILNKFEDADELLERRAGMYSDRPQYPIVPLMGMEYNIALLPHGDEWRVRRKVCQQHFRAAEAPKFLPTQVKKVNEMLQGLLTRPEDFEKHNKKLSISIPLATMYGYDLESLDDPVISIADESIVLGVPLLLPGGTIVNILPFLGRLPSWIPGIPSLRTASKVKILSEEMRRIPMDYVKERMLKGTARPSLVTEFFEKKFRVGATKEEEEIIDSIANTVYGAASDTTISATGTFFYHIAKHPEVQKKAQAEIDRVTGGKRLPEYSDRLSGNLPYVEAIYREVMRMAPPLPVGIPHTATEDDYYKGYYIPKGTAIISNIWAMAYDEDKYADPYKFNPDRFFDESGMLNDDSRVLAYGFGRRVCVGKHVASSTLWLLFASVLACFDINKARDESGNEIDINDDYHEFGLVVRKADFQCSIKVRSKELKRLIEDAETEL